MHFYTHISEKTKGLSGEGGNFYSDAMVEHDNHVGRMLDLLDRLGIADNTIVMYSTDNGPHTNEWPDGGTAPFRGEKNTNWEGGFRVPTVVRWPGHIEPNSVTNEIVSHQDWLPTLMAAVGDTKIKKKLLKGHIAGNRTYKVHLDGHLLICERQNSFISAVTPSSGLTLTTISTTTGGQNGLHLSHFPCKKR